MNICSLLIFLSEKYITFQTIALYWYLLLKGCWRFSQATSLCQISDKVSLWDCPFQFSFFVNHVGMMSVLLDQSFKYLAHCKVFRNHQRRGEIVRVLFELFCVGHNRNVQAFNETCLSDALQDHCYTVAARRLLTLILCKLIMESKYNFPVSSTTATAPTSLLINLCRNFNVGSWKRLL